MDESIESESNRELAKAHVNYVGSYLERVHKMSNKGVHAQVGQVEAVKAIFHTYLVVADILGYMKKPSNNSKMRLNIHTASIDELISVLGISKTVAKEIIKLRVEHGVLDLELLATVKGIGQRTISVAKESLSFEPSDE